MDDVTLEHEVDRQVLNRLSEVLARSLCDIDLDASFVANGGDSLKAVLLTSSLKAQGCHVTRESLFTAPCLTDVLGPLTLLLPADSPDLGMPKKISSFPPSSDASSPSRGSDPSPGSTPPSSTTNSLLLLNEGDMHDFRHFSLPPPPPPPQDSEVMDLVTEMQGSLIHETYAHCGSNVIVYVEHHPSERVPVLFLAWKRAMALEAIFQGSWFRELSSTRSRDQSEWLGFSLDMAPCDPGTDGRPISKIIWQVHHAFIDSWSLHLLLLKVRNIAKGAKAEPGPSFWEWSRHLRCYQAANKSHGDAFWRETMSRIGDDATGTFLLPSASRGPAAGASAGATNLAEPTSSSERVVFEIGAEAAIAAAKLSNVTPAAVFYAAWALVVAAFTDSDSVVFGAVLSGRSLDISGSLEVVGPLINVLPLYVRLDRGASMGAFVANLFRDLVRLDTFSWTTTANGFTRQYDSAISVEMMEPSELKNHPLCPLETYTTQRSQVPISITVRGLSKVELQFHPDRFCRRDMLVVAECYERAIWELTKPSLHTTVGATLHGLLLCHWHARLMKWGNGISGLTTRSSVVQDLVTLFEAVVAAHPNAVAVEKGCERLTYHELDEMSAQVAAKLSTMTSPGDVVCVHSDRSIRWIGAIWGVLKAGCVYCSLDPDLPPQLRDTMVLTAAASVFVAGNDEQLREVTPAASQKSFSVESAAGGPLLPAEHGCGPLFPRRVSAQPWAAAYVCFTSGSTGVPKPVLCSHGGLVAFQSDLQVRLHAQPGVRVAQIMSVAFDGSIHEIFSALTHGATLVLPAGADSLAPLAAAHSAILTPSVARALDPGDHPDLRWVYLVGEPVPQHVADTWSSPKTLQLFNMYGPTEATCGATIKRLLPGRPVTIGVPNPTTRLYILGTRGGLIQPGMVGRIHLAGVQVAQGYLGMPQQTEARFKADSIMGNGERMYDTGDLGYWNEDGEVVCIGRTDRQVKLRGYRLDLNDLEIRITRCIKEVQAVAIALRHDAPDELVAMVQPASMDLVWLRSRIADTLPRYAIPAYLVSAEKIPTTSAGKVDYKAVASAEAASPKDWERFGSHALATDLERTVAAAFRTVLAKPATTPMSRDDSFVDLGGYSMEQIKLARHLTKALGVPVTLKTIISNTTIQTLAHAIDQIISSEDARRPPPTSTLVDLVDDVTPIEQEWLDKSHVGGSSISCFNVGFVGRVTPGLIEHDRLEDAFNTVLRRHKILRNTYHVVRGPYRPRHRRRVSEYYPRAQRVQKIDTWAELNRPYRLSEELPVRVMIARDCVIVTMSHVVADYTTMAVLLSEVSSAYHGRDLPAQYGVYPDPALWGEDSPADHCEFWRQQLEEAPAQPRLVQSSQQQRVNYGGRSTLFRFNQSTSSRILGYVASSKAISLQQLALAAVALALHSSDSAPGSARSPSLDVILGMPFMNRESDEHADTVGLFLQPLPIRIRHHLAGLSSTTKSTTSEAAAILAAVQQETQSALAHRLPWHQLLQAVSVAPDYPDHPLFDIMVTFLDPAMVKQLNLQVPGIDPCFAWSLGAKFKLMCEFMAASETTIMMRLEYDHSCILSSEIASFQRRVARFMSALVTDEPDADMMIELNIPRTRQSVLFEGLALMYSPKRLVVSGKW
ncbi:hypothetical protein B0T14DRAFT_590199 [Immersiella caudata]|uniref:Carrier domain-containing protein n=1 Tax=Immersiella caudata TaxID=314043 RepID=A0AA39WL94_9PEZI|nr:hypothetical protein B0T14DRAFT_590199 [Immersiella caudata]